MATSYESVEDLAEALRRAAEAHGEHERRTGEEDPNCPIGTPSTWCASAPARSCLGEKRQRVIV